MLKCKHRTLIFIGGAIWLVIGIFLLSLGINFLLETLRFPYLIQQSGRFSIISFFSRFLSDRSHSVIIVVTLSLLIGYYKGKFMLGKSVARQIKRITTLPNPASLKYLYSKGYYILIASMMGMGFVVRLLPITLDTRGAIDAAIGSALINGAMLFFRAGSSYTQVKSKGQSV